MRHDQLVGKQMRRWEIDSRVRDLFQRGAEAGPPRTSVVTISRELGSGGTHIARMVARELGYTLFDKEIVDHVATLWGVDSAQIAHLDERRADFWGDLVLQFIEGKRPTEASYLRALVRAMRDIAQTGNAIVLGRASTCILKDSYRVRIVAPEPLRVERIAGIHHVDERRARRMVMESDRNRRHFVRAYFGYDIQSPLIYDMVVNTERCTLDHAATLVVQGYRDRQAYLAERAASRTHSAA